MTPPFDFKGYRVVVAGGSRGIGRTIALGFAQTGASVSVCARDPDMLDDAQRAIAAHGVMAHRQRCDDDEDGWAAGIEIDLLAAVRASRTALPYLQTSQHASILHTTSISAFHPLQYGAPYGAVKAALVHYTTSQALTLAKDRIRVNSIAPGSILFPGGVWEQCREQRPEMFDATLAGIPFGRFGTPDEIANVALFLASPFAGWITGQTLVVDGGQSLKG